MAATQAEKQQNDVNSEKVQPDQQQHLNVRNSLLQQNGTDKCSPRGSAGGVVVSKAAKNTGSKNLGIDMSQYRQDGAGGGNTGSEQQQQQQGLTEPEAVESTGGCYPPTPSEGPPIGVGGDSRDSHGGVGVGVGGGYSGFPFGSASPRDMHNQHGNSGSDGGGMHVAFGHRQQFGGPKPAGGGGPGGPGTGAVPGPGGGSSVFPQQPLPQRLHVSGQAISQSTGPTPTLNQLLQSSNPMRYHNNYEQSYTQGWPPQKPPYGPGAGLPPGPYRNQTTLSGGYGPGPGGGYNDGGGGGRAGWPGGPPVQQQGPPPPPASSHGHGPPQQQHAPGSPGGPPPPPPTSQQQQPPPIPSSQQQPPPTGSSAPASQQSPQQQSGGPPTSQAAAAAAASSGSHSPGPGTIGVGMPPSPSQHPPHTGNYSQRPPQPTTPNAHAPDQGDLSGGNSNDSSGGPAPGTPNSQSGMRPTPSPTGSTGSRSMSPAVGQQNIPMPPRPSSGQSDGSGSTRLSHSPMTTSGNYPPAHMQHVSAGYKSHPGMVPSAGQQMPLYQPGSQPYQQGAYPGRPSQQYPNQVYGPPPGATNSQQPSAPNNIMPSQSQQPYPNTNRTSGGPNHIGSGVGGNSQFPPYQPSWPPGPGNHNMGGPNVPSPNGGGKGNNGPPGGGGGGGGPVQQSPNSPSNNQPRPPHYLKQHLQQKMGFSNALPPSPSPPQNYHMGPPHHSHSGMGPPPIPNMPPNMANMPPATSPLLPNNHPIGVGGHEGPMPPPSSTPNSHHPLAAAAAEMMDNGITTQATGGLSTHVTTTSGGSVTSVVTTGPDGTPIDEGSQQSTLSNASAASGEDPQCTTPKRKNDLGHYSHPTTPQSTVPSPGAASMNSMHDDYELSSPGWPRTPASPVFNTHVPPTETYRSKKTDSLGKLYEMDDSPDRRGWLDKLLAFMEERRTPITTCPTISKNPLDLFRLYVFVKERGGFMEVTKNKTWKDIAGMLGIGASSSAAYTLRKHYTKNLLAYECQFDRGGIDPQPIINQVEATSKKKTAKNASVPSPGSSNSQDSFPAPVNLQGSGGNTPLPGGGGGGPPVSGSGSMDGYGSAGSGYGYPPPGSGDGYGATSRPNSQPNAPSPHAGGGGSNHLGNTGPGGPSPGVNADNVNVSNPFDDVSPSPPPPRGGPYPSHPYPQPTSGAGGPNRPPAGYAGGGPGGGGGGGGPPPNTPGYPQYPGSGGPPGSSGPPPTSADQYPPYNSSGGGGPQTDGRGNYPPTSRPYPPYPGDSSGPPANVTSGGGASPGPTTVSSGGAPVPPGVVSSVGSGGGPQDPYSRFAGSVGGGVGGPPSVGPPGAGGVGPGGYAARPPYATGGGAPPVGASGGGGGGGSAGGPATQSPNAPYPGQQDYFRPDQSGGVPGGYPGGPLNKNMPPPAPQPPRRHPDFVKDPQQNYSQYGPGVPGPQRPQIYGGWPNNTQYRGQYPGGPSGNQPPPPPQWQSGGGASRGPPGSGGNQWNTGAERYPGVAGSTAAYQQQPPQQQQQQAQQQPPPPNQQQQQQQQQQWSMGQGIGQSSPLRPPPGGVGGPRGASKPYSMLMASGGVKPTGISTQQTQPQSVISPAYASQQQQPPLPPQPLQQPSLPSTSPQQQSLQQQPLLPLPGQLSQQPHPAQQSLQQIQPPLQQQQMQQQQPVPQQQQQAMPKREITFPPDSVEATPAVIYRRKRLCRSDVGQIDAWRLIMSLRSGLLAESCYALDILNVLLFDDTAIAYFGLTHWPGLLDLLQEHFRKSLVEMFERGGGGNGSGGGAGLFGGSQTVRTFMIMRDGRTPSRETLIEEATGAEDVIDMGLETDPLTNLYDVDLGGVTADDIDCEARTTMLNRTSNYTLTTRKGFQVKLIERNDEIFIRDHHREWDTKGDAAGVNLLEEVTTDPWYLKADHILPTFQAEFGQIPFHRHLAIEPESTITIPRPSKSSPVAATTASLSSSSSAVKAECTITASLQDTKATSNAATTSPESPQPTEKVLSRLFSDKKQRRTKTLSDVISRIKKDTTTSTTAAATASATIVSSDNSTDENSSASEQMVVNSSSNSSSSELNGTVAVLDVPSATAITIPVVAASKNKCDMERTTTISAATASTSTTTTTTSICGAKLQVRDVAATLKRRRMSDYEDESYARDEASLMLVTESQDCVGKRCVCISNILRNLTFVPGNETEFARSGTFLGLVGKLLLLHHEHPARTQKTRNYDREEDADFADSCSSLQGETEWWWEYLLQIRENILVCLANIAGQIDLDQYAEPIARPLLDGLLHWAICPSAQGQDPFASAGPTSMLSPQRLALEALCKLCVTNGNVDLVIATPPFSRLERLCTVLTKHLCRSEDQVLREFAINLLHYLAAADSTMARVVAAQQPCVSLLVAFIEQAEQSALGVANQHGIGALRDNPDSMGTSLDMLRRAASTLVFLAEHPDNRPLLVQQEARLLALVMSQILDQQVALLLSKVLYKISNS